MEETISVILTVYNQEQIIQQVARGILENKSEQVKEILFIVDGCTDNSENKIDEIIPEFDIVVKKIITPNLNETLANNVGFKNSECDYSIIVQDDCIITEKNFDKRLLKPFKLFSNLLAVSGRDAVDTRIINGKLDYYNCGGADVNTPRNIFSIRDAINRGPLMLDNKKLKQLNYLDESFAPLNSDDVELSIRAYLHFGYIVGSYVVKFYSPEMWGTTRKNPESNRIYEWSQAKNMATIVERYYNHIIGEKHSEDINIGENI